MDISGSSATSARQTLAQKSIPQRKVSLSPEAFTSIAQAFTRHATISFGRKSASPPKLRASPSLEDSDAVESYIKTLREDGAARAEQPQPIKMPAKKASIFRSVVIESLKTYSTMMLESGVKGGVDDYDPRTKAFNDHMKSCKSHFTLGWNKECKELLLGKGKSASKKLRKSINQTVDRKSVFDKYIELIENGIGRKKSEILNSPSLTDEIFEDMKSSMVGLDESDQECLKNIIYQDLLVKFGEGVISLNSVKEVLAFQANEMRMKRCATGGTTDGSKVAFEEFKAFMKRSRKSATDNFDPAVADLKESLGKEKSLFPIKLSFKYNYYQSSDGKAALKAIACKYYKSLESHFMAKKSNFIEMGREHLQFWNDTTHDVNESSREELSNLYHGLLDKFYAGEICYREFKCLFEEGVESIRNLQDPSELELQIKMREERFDYTQTSSELKELLREQTEVLSEFDREEIKRAIYTPLIVDYVNGDLILEAFAPKFKMQVQEYIETM